jgi:sugar transferase (PEP-CTERM/EpsH1 system associated)
MIIVIAQRIPFPPNKGEKLRTYHHIKRMVELGHDVEVLSLSHQKDDVTLANALAAELSISVRLFPLANKLWRYSKAILAGQSLSEGAFFSTGLKRYLKEEVTQLGACTVYMSASSLAPYALGLSLHQKQTIKLIMDFMDVDSDKWQQYAKTSQWPMNCVYQRESKKIRKLEYDTVKHFDNTFLIADAEIALFSKHVCQTDNITKLGNGMDFSAFFPDNTAPKTPHPTFLFTGVMDYKPNIDAVVWFVEQCWQTIKKHSPQARFVIAGMKPSAQIQHLSQIEGIEVTGFVDDILPYYHDAWVFVAPFRLARGVQNKVLQASACRLPIVTTQMGAEGISFANPQTMYFAESSEDFAKACIDAISNVEDSSTKAQAVFDAIRARYSWETQLNPLMEAINS